MKRLSWLRAVVGASFAAAVIAVVPSAPVRADDTGAKVYANGLKSTVWIVIKEANGTRMGSGSVIDVQQKLVLTNYHVIQGKKDCLVMFPFYDANGELVCERKQYFERIKDKGAIPAKVEFHESKRDLAVIRLKSLPRDAKAVKLSEKSPPTGSRVFSIGNAGASDALWVFTPGEVRQVYNKRWTPGGADDRRFEIDARVIETTSPSNPGDSGGPLFNDKGEQVGVCQGGLASFAGNSIAWFMDIHEIRGLLKDHGIKLTDRPKEVVKEEPPIKSDDKGAVVEKKTTDTKDKTEAKPGKASAADEKKAEVAFALAKSLADAGRKEGAMERLKKLIKEYPNTSAARDAEDLLAKLEGR
jgi:S1-C subfamily serine protease